MDTSFLLIGKFGRPFGVRGFLSLHSHASPPESIFKYDALYVYQNDQYQRLPIEKTQQHGQKLYLKLKGWDAPETARIWVNQSIFIEKASLEPLSEKTYYWVELEGLQVINEAGVTLGRVQEMMRTPHHDVLVVKGTKTHLIPFDQTHYVKQVDLPGQRIEVRWEEDF